MVLVDFFWQNRVGTLDRVYLDVIATRCGWRVSRGLFQESWLRWGMGYGDGRKTISIFVGYLIKPNLIFEQIPWPPSYTKNIHRTNNMFTTQRRTAPCTSTNSPSTALSALTSDVHMHPMTQEPISWRNLTGHIHNVKPSTGTATEHRSNV